MPHVIQLSLYIPQAAYKTTDEQAFLLFCPSVTATPLPQCVHPSGLVTIALHLTTVSCCASPLPNVSCSLYIPQAWYKTVGGQGAFRTTIYLPPGASQTPMVQGDYHQNQKSAKNAAALAAIKQLHQEGKMTDCLFPSWVSAHHAQQLGTRGMSFQERDLVVLHAAG